MSTEQFVSQVFRRAKQKEKCYIKITAKLLFLRTIKSILTIVFVKFLLLLLLESDSQNSSPLLPVVQIRLQSVFMETFYAKPEVHRVKIETNTFKNKIESNSLTFRTVSWEQTSIYSLLESKLCEYNNKAPHIPPMVSYLDSWEGTAIYWAKYWCDHIFLFSTICQITDA